MKLVWRIRICSEVSFSVYGNGGNVVGKGSDEGGDRGDDSGNDMVTSVTGSQKIVVIVVRGN